MDKPMAFCISFIAFKNSPVFRNILTLIHINKMYSPVLIRFAVFNFSKVS